PRSLFPERHLGHYVYDQPALSEVLRIHLRQIRCKPDLQVACFDNAYAKEVHNLDLARVLHRIFAGKYREQIYDLRQKFAAWKAVCPALDRKDSREAKAYDAGKRQLPAFCVSGTARSRTEMLEHSNLLQIDCDHLGERLPGLRTQLKEDPHVAFGFR